jgi:hypothetical protein
MNRKPATLTPAELGEDAASRYEAEFRANAEEGRKYRAEQERRAKAYPQLVEELKKTINRINAAHFDTERKYKIRDDAIALLRSLGEDA